MCAPGAAAPAPAILPLSLSMTNNDGYSCQARRLRGREGGCLKPRLCPLPAPRAPPHRADSGEPALGARQCAGRGHSHEQDSPVPKQRSAHRSVGAEKGHEAERGVSPEKGARELGLEHQPPGSCGGRGLFPGGRAVHKPGGAGLSDAPPPPGVRGLPSPCCAKPHGALRPPTPSGSTCSGRVPRAALRRVDLSGQGRCSRRDSGESAWAR